MNPKTWSRGSWFFALWWFFVANATGGLFVSIGTDADDLVGVHSSVWLAHVWRLAVADTVVRSERAVIVCFRTRFFATHVFLLLLLLLRHLFPPC